MESNNKSDPIQNPNGCKTPAENKSVNENKLTNITVTIDKEDGGNDCNGSTELCEISLKKENNFFIGSDKKEFLCAPRNGHRMSFMEEESAKDRLRLSLLKQCSAILKQGEQKYTKESLHRAFQDEDLSDRIFRLFDVEKLDHLVQDDWIEFIKLRITEDKQIELVEQLESVAYVVCGEGVVSAENFYSILRNKVVTNKLFRVVDTDGDGYVTADEVMEFFATISSPMSRAGLDRHSVEQLEQLFRQTVGDEKEITKEQFKKILVSKNEFFTERVFQIFDTDDSGAVSLREFVDAVHSFASQSADDKIRFLFRVYDLDGDGLIQHRELQHVMRACLLESGMSVSTEQLHQITDALFTDADPAGRGAITYEGLKQQLMRHEGLIENLSISIDRWLIPPKVKPEPKSLLQRIKAKKPYQLSIPYIRNNYTLVGYLVVYTLINFGLFVSRCYEYRESNGFVILARGCGQLLNLNASWVCVLALRGAVTALRARGAAGALPLDHLLYLHKLTGLLVAALALLHTAMHLANFGLIVVNDPIVNHGNYTISDWLLTSKPGQFGLVAGLANPTGIALAFILAAICLCSQPSIRRGGNFEVFYWSHLLYVPFWLLTILHAPNFWKWFILPGLAYLIERIYRIASMRSSHGRTYISSGILLPSRVVHLVVARPREFSFSAGDYVFLNIPEIAQYEWHPFTISSAPEQEDHIWLHVRAVGQWTNKLYDYFEKEQNRLHGEKTTLTDGHDKLERTTSNQSTTSKASKRRDSGGKKRSVEFSPITYTNHAFIIEDELSPPANGLSPLPPLSRPGLLAPMRSLEKSSSMPDVHKMDKKKERLAALRDYTRSESEHRLHAASLALPAEHCELERSFRYMRTKPTIIAFKAPNTEEYERRRSNESIITIARRRLSKSLSPDKETEAERPGELPDRTQPAYPVGLPLEIYLDGPYGAASSNIFSAQHAVLIAAGIGVTPFASILQSLARRHRARTICCPNCSHAWAPHNPHSRPNKVDFFWINREQQSFEWFVSLLSQLEMEQAEMVANNPGQERFLDMHMYITSALQRHDMKAVALQLALDLLHQKEKRDLITGLKTRTTAGRPNWDKVFRALLAARRGRVSVFYCGPPALARLLRARCHTHGFHFAKEVF